MRRDDPHDTRELARRVGKAQAEDLALRRRGVLVAKNRKGRVRVVDDEADDAVIAGVGGAVAAHVDAGLDEGIEHADKVPRLAFDEYADLRYAHEGLLTRFRARTKRRA